jgi:division protein CdvB (Snf7/Vps24/ESCRT-III family)
LILRYQLARHIDQALPGKHTRKIYDTLNKRNAKMLVQLRTGKSRLNTYLSSIGACDSDRCE